MTNPYQVPVLLVPRGAGLPISLYVNPDYPADIHCLVFLAFREDAEIVTDNLYLYSKLPKNESRNPNQVSRREDHL